MTAIGTFPKVTGDALDYTEINTIFYSVPIGTILPWAKSITGVPALPAQFVECNGSVLSDAASPLNGQTMPDLNTTKRFLRGSATSGTTGGSDTVNLEHTHGLTSIGSISLGGGGGSTVTLGTPNNGLSATTSTLSAYMEVVYIIRVK